VAYDPARIENAFDVAEQLADLFLWRSPAGRGDQAVGQLQPAPMSTAAKPIEYVGAGADRNLSGTSKRAGDPGFCRRILGMGPLGRETV